MQEDIGSIMVAADNGAMKEVKGLGEGTNYLIIYSNFSCQINLTCLESNLLITKMFWTKLFVFLNTFNYLK